MMQENDILIKNNTSCADSSASKSSKSPSTASTKDKKNESLSTSYTTSYDSPIVKGSTADEDESKQRDKSSVKYKSTFDQKKTTVNAEKGILVAKSHF